MIVLTSDEEKSRLELLEDDDPLALVDPGQYNGDGAIAQGRTNLAHLTGEKLLGSAGGGPETKNRKLRDKV